MFLGLNNGFVKCDRSGLDVGAVGDNNGSFSATVTISPASGSAPVTQTVTVSSKQAWTDTGLTVSQGDVISIAASGTITWDTAGRNSGSNGSESDSCSTLITKQVAPTNSLVGNVAPSASLDGNGFYVGSSYLRWYTN